MVREFKSCKFWDQCVAALWNSHLGMPNKKLLLILNICIFNNKTSRCSPLAGPGSSFHWVRTGCSLKPILSSPASLHAGNSSPLWLVLADFPLKLDPFSMDQRRKMRNMKLLQWNFSSCSLSWVSIESSLLGSWLLPAEECAGVSTRISIPLAQVATWTPLLREGYPAKGQCSSQSHREFCQCNNRQQLCW